MQIEYNSFALSGNSTATIQAVTESEIVILNYLFYHASAIDFVADKLQPHHFSSRNHQVIFKAILDCNQENLGESCFLEVINYLSTHKHDDVTATSYRILQGSLIQVYNEQEDLNKHIKIVQNSYQRNHIKHLALEIAKVAQDPLSSLADIKEVYDKLTFEDTHDTKDKKLKLEISNYLTESDHFKKVRLKRKIQTHYSLSRHDFLYLVRSLENDQAKPKRQSLGVKEFLALDFSVSKWIVPGLIPLGESIIFSGTAKCGKSNLMGDLVHAMVTGGEFLGEKVPQNKVLYGACDESLRDLRKRVDSRGIDLVPNLKDYFALQLDIDLDNLNNLITKIEAEQPKLIIIDNLTTIARNVDISENNAEFAHYLYKFNRIAQDYNCSFIILHHENKNFLAEGIDSVSGSSRILAAPWAIWQLKRISKKNPLDPKRILHIQPRSETPQKLALEFNHRPEWSSKGIFRFIHEIGDESNMNKTHAQKILDALKYKDLEGLELREITGIPQASIYKVLDRMESRGQIKKRRSKTNLRFWVYYLPDSQQIGGISQQEINSTNLSTIDPPPPPQGSLSFVQSKLKNNTNQSFAQSDTNLTPSPILSDTSDSTIDLSNWENPNNSYNTTSDMTPNVCQGGGGSVG